MNSVSTVTNGSARSRAQRAARRRRCRVIEDGGREVRRGLAWHAARVNTERDLTPQSRGFARRLAEDRTPCTPTAPIPAARSAPPTPAATARLSGWIHSKRDHGGLLFIDLRDHYGLTQCVLPAGRAAFRGGRRAAAGERDHRDRQGGAAQPGTVNPKLPTGEIELRVETLEVQSRGRRAADPGRGRARAIRRSCGCATASSTCGASGCSAT